MHKCKREYIDRPGNVLDYIECVEDEFGTFWLVHDYAEVIIDFCPICGEKAPMSFEQQEIH